MSATTQTVEIEWIEVSHHAADLDALLGAPRDGSLQLLGPFDPYLQLRDRALLVPDAAKRKALWPVLGRPGAVAIGGEIVGLWRPRTSGRKLTVRLTPWEPIRKPDRARIEARAHELAEFRGLSAAEVVDA